MAVSEGGAPCRLPSFISGPSDRFDDHRAEDEQLVGLYFTCLSATGQT
jgi:hypothetical protein